MILSAEPHKENDATVRRVVIDELPRLPFEASIDLTYRCNNCCRHCWLWLPENAPDQAGELTFEEWREVIDQARVLGTQRWAISGGEPMLREDFSEIFEYATSKAIGYSLNTNGTLITPEIARQLRRKGDKMVAVYGATAEVYDHVTRNPGGFEALQQGLAYMKEAGAGFTVQLIPMRDNWHQWDRMQEFARSLSPRYRVGAAWFWKSASGDAARNAEIERQRLDPADVIELDTPKTRKEAPKPIERETMRCVLPGKGLYGACIEERRDFHVDPYGGMSFCSFVKDPQFRYDLRQGDRRGIPSGALASAWDEHIPSLADVTTGVPEYAADCGQCDLKAHCRWCDVYSYLETGRHGAKIDYLCRVAEEARAYVDKWSREHTRFFEVGGVTVQVESDLPITDFTFHSKFRKFRVDGPGEDTVIIRHHFGMPDLSSADMADPLYINPPWAIYRQGQSWIYMGIAPTTQDSSPQRVAVFNADHTRGELYNAKPYSDTWLAGGLPSLTMFPTDQILLGRLFADREACILHSGALALDGQGLMFVGHSEAGKSTTMRLVRQGLGERVEILCDDRNVVRRWSQGLRVHGTWSHGDVPEVSSASAPLRAILFLEQHETNEILPLDDRKVIWKGLLATLIKPMVTGEWWQREIDVLEQIVSEVPCYLMRFDRTGKIVPELERLLK